MGSAGPQQNLSIIIVGAGIGGLGAACALSRKGHKVTVLEDKPALNEFGASIGISPSGVRVLESYGLREEFNRVVTKNKYLELRTGTTGDVIGRVTHNAGNASSVDFGAETWNIHRADYQQTLGAAAQANGAEILFNADVVWVDAQAEKPVVYLKDRRQLTADLVVGADGLRSIVRASIPATANVHPKKLHEQCWRLTVPKDAIRDNPQLSWLLTSGNEICWASHNQYVLSWPLPPNRPYDVVCCIVRESDGPPGLWGVKEDPSNVRTAFATFCPEVVELLRHADRAIKWTLAELPPLTTCRSANGRVVLLGDAFHAMIPHAGSGGNSAIEDGAVLAECVEWACAHGRSVSDVTGAYEAVRKPRAEKLQRLSRDMYGFLNAGGEEAEKRDARMKAMTAAEVERLAVPEEERRRVPKAVPDENAMSQTREFRQWLRGYDAVGEAKRYCEEFMS